MTVSKAVSEDDLNKVESYVRALKPVEIKGTLKGRVVFRLKVIIKKLNNLFHRIQHRRWKEQTALQTFYDLVKKMNLTLTDLNSPELKKEVGRDVEIKFRVLVNKRIETIKNIAKELKVEGNADFAELDKHGKKNEETLSGLKSEKIVKQKREESVDEDKGSITAKEKESITAKEKESITAQTAKKRVEALTGVRRKYPGKLPKPTRKERLVSETNPTTVAGIPDEGEVKEQTDEHQNKVETAAIAASIKEKALRNCPKIT